MKNKPKICVFGTETTSETKTGLNINKMDEKKEIFSLNNLDIN